MMNRKALVRMVCRPAIIGLLMFLALGPVAAQPAANGGPPSPCDLAEGGSGEVAEIIDGDTLVLADGRAVRLAEIEAPKRYLAPAGADITALAEEARGALARLAGRRWIDLRWGETGHDRHGRVLAQVFLDDGTWLQAAMVEGGLARVRAMSANSPCLDDLLARERMARKGRLGVWRGADFVAIAANDSSLLGRKGLYVFVEGRVVSVGRGKRVDFLNFGHYWRRDFTVTVETSISGRLAERGLPVETLAGRRVRVRGVIEESGGPAIRLAHPSEIEVLGND